MEAVFKFWKQDSGEGIFEAGFENITDVESIQTIDIEFNNTGKFIPAFIYSQEELDQIQANNAAYEEAMTKVNSKRYTIPPEPEPVIPEFPKTGKYFSPRLLEELQKFTNLKEINIIANGRPVEVDDSFPTYCQVNIIDSTSDGAKSAVRAVVPVISTPADLFALMQSTNTVEMADTYTLANDIDMTGFVCESIGRIATPFTGFFVGNGYTIRIADVSSTVFGGLFGLVTTGTIQNVNVIYTNANLTLNGLIIITSPNTIVYNGGLTASIDGLGNATNCNVVYDGNIIITGDRNGGFGNLTNGAICDMCTLTTNGTMTFNNGRSGGAFANVFTNCTLSNFTYTAKDDIVINSTFVNSAGCIGIVNESIVNNFTAVVNGNLSVVGNINNGGCIGAVFNNSQITDINCTFKNINIENSGYTMGGFAGIINDTDVSNVVFNANDLTMNSPYDTSIFISDASGSTISNCSIVLTGNVLSSCLYFGGLCGYIGNGTTITITDCSCLVNKDVNCTQLDVDGYIGGMYGVIFGTGQYISTNSSVFYGANTEFNADYVGGIAVENNGSHINDIVVYNNYTFTGTTVAAKFASGTGTETNCFVNTFSTDTSVIPNTNTANVLAALADEPTTAWLSGLLKIRQNLDVSNNSQSLSSIFTSSPATSNTAKNNALNASMVFAGVAYINTTPSIIQPLLVKYSSILPSNIRYAVPDENNEIDVSDAMSYYIYQNPAYIVPANKTILSSTEGDGSVTFDTEVVPVGSKTTINDVVYNVVGVGSSLIEVVKGGNETTSSNSLSIAFAIIAGVILLLVVVFTYLYGWRGYMFLPVIIAVVLAVLAIVYAFN